MALLPGKIVMDKIKPNILWLMTDEQRTDSLGCYGSTKMKTPSIDRLAKKGILFKNAICQSPVCAPSRASMLTGRYCRELSMYHNKHRCQTDVIAFPEIFQRLGYDVTDIGKYHANLKRCPFKTRKGVVISKDVGYCGLSDKYKMEDYGIVQYPVKGNVYQWLFGGTRPGSINEVPEKINADQAIEYLKNIGSAPSFLRVSFLAPHTPVVAPPPFDKMFKGDEVKFTEFSGEEYKKMPEFIKKYHLKYEDARLFTPEQMMKIRATYYGLVSFVDQQFGRVLDALEISGRAEDTIIIFSSDHGTHLGDHGLMQKQTFYEAVVKVPLIISWQGHLPEGKIVEEQIELVDVFPTVMETAGFKNEIPKDISGKSFVPFLEGHTKSHKDVTFSEVGFEWDKDMEPHRPLMVRTPEWKLTYFPEGYNPGGENDGALYSLKDDPAEINNIFHEEKSRAIIRDLIKLGTGSYNRPII